MPAAFVQPIERPSQNLLNFTNVVINMLNDVNATASDWIARVAWASDLVSTVAIVFCNKLLMNRYGFQFPVTLCALHFVVTAVVVHVINYLAKNPKSCGSDRPVPLYMIVTFALLGSAGIVLANVSLCVNSVAFYQIVKLATLPLVACFEAVAGARTYSRQQCGYFIIILAGVATTVTGSVRTSSMGAFVAAASVFTTACHQFMCALLQSSFGVTSNKLLSQVSPIKATMLLLCSQKLDSMWAKDDLHVRNISHEARVLVILSCLLAAVINISQFTVVRHYGAGVAQAMNQMKTVAIVFGGSLMLDGYVSPNQVAGTLAAVCGVMLLLSKRSVADCKASLPDTDSMSKKISEKASQVGRSHTQPC